MVAFRRRNPPLYDPSTDSTLEMWMDPSDSSTSSLKDTGGGAIVNGATVGTWSSKKGPTRDFIQWGANGRPTWVTNAINGLPAVRFQTQMLTTQSSVSVFSTISAVTLMRVLRGTTAGAAFNLSCLDPNTGFSDITQWGQSGNSYFMNGWRRPRIDSFQSFAGDATPASNIYITTSIWDFTNAQATMYQCGVEGPVFKSSFGSAGNSASTAYALTFGGFAQQTGLSNGAPDADGYVGETLLWLSAKTPDQLEEPHNYLRLKWGIS